MEIFDIYDASGQPIGQARRELVHRQGIWHRAVNVFLFNSKGELLIQQRSAGKDICPGLWDLSVAEHLQPGETYIDAACRGLQEEINIICDSANELIALGTECQGRYQEPERHIKDYEFQQCYKLVTDAEAHADEIEVQALQYCSLHDLAARMTDMPTLFTPWFHRLVKFTGLIE
jgi:isopentenyl-diphosphate delta-isomerase type 1